MQGDSWSECQMGEEVRMNMGENMEVKGGFGF